MKIKTKDYNMLIDMIADYDEALCYLSFQCVAEDHEVAAKRKLDEIRDKYKEYYERYKEYYERR